NRAVVPGCETARTRPVWPGRPVLPCHVRLGQRRRSRARERPAEEVRERRGLTPGRRAELDRRPPTDARRQHRTPSTASTASRATLTNQSISASVITSGGAKNRM